MKTAIQDIPALTGLRGVAAFIVVLYHANLSAFRGFDSASGVVFVKGQLYVDIFFVLSGFVISHVYLSRKSMKWFDFFIARFARVYPLHIATALTAALGIYILGRLAGVWPKELSLGEAAREFTLTHAMPLVWQDLLWNSPSWSVSVEFWTYFIVFPVLVLISSRIGPHLAASVSMIILFAALVWLSVIDVDQARGWPALVRSIVGFTAGWACWRVYCILPKERVPGIITDILAGAILIVTQLSDRNPWLILLLVPPFIVFLTTSQSVTRWFLELPWVVYAGLISYSVYLIHPIVLKCVQIFARKFDFLATNVPFFMVMTVFIVTPIAAMSYCYFEGPTRNAIRNVSSFGKRHPYPVAEK